MSKISNLTNSFILSDVQKSEFSPHDFINEYLRSVGLSTVSERFDIHFSEGKATNNVCL